MATGPQRASFLNVQNLATSSKCNPDGQVFKYGYPSTHFLFHVRQNHEIGKEKSKKLPI